MLLKEKTKRLLKFKLLSKKIRKRKSIENQSPKKNQLKVKAKTIPKEDAEITKKDEKSMEIEEIKNIEQNMQQGLVKVWEPVFELPTLYTGGKLIVDEEQQCIYSLCNFEIIKFGMNDYQIEKKILHTNEEILNFDINFKNQLIATFTRNHLFRILSLVTYKVLKLWKLPDFIAQQLEFDSSGQFIVLSSIHGLVKLYDIKHGQQTHEFKVNGQINKIMFHPQIAKLQLIFGGEDCCLRIYDLVIKKSLKAIKLNQEISSFALDYENKYVFVITFDHLLSGFSLQNFKKMFEFQLPEETLCVNYFESENEQFLILGGESGIPLLLNITNLENIISQKLTNFGTHKIMELFTLRKLGSIGILTSEQNLTLMNYKDLSLNKHLVLNNDEIIDLKFSKHNKKTTQQQNIQDFIVFATNSSLLKVLWPQDKNRFEFLIGHTNIILSVITMDNLIVSSSKDNTIKLWEFVQEKFELICSFCGHTEPAATLAISKSKMLLSGAKDMNIKLWDLQQALNQYKKIGKAIKIDSAKRTVLAHNKDINAVTISDNSKFFASASQDKTIKVWNMKTFATKFILAGHKRGVWDAAFSSFEKVLASGSADGTIKLWNLVDGSCLNTLEGHSSSVLKICWISYGLQLLSVGGDSVIKLWNYKKGICMKSFEKHEGKIWALDIQTSNKAFQKQQIITGGNDGLFCLWQDKTEEEETKQKELDFNYITQQQNYSNYYHNKQYLLAAKLAFESNMIKGFISAIEALFNETLFESPIIFEDTQTNFQQPQEKNNEELVSLINDLIQSNFDRFLHFIRDMNSTSSHYKYSQKLMEIMLKNININSLAKYSETFKQIDKLHKKDDKNIAINAADNQSDFQKWMAILILYSEKHQERIERFVKKSYYLDFILNKLNVFID